MTDPDEFDRLLAEAERQPFSGWDFSWLGRGSVDAVSESDAYWSIRQGP